MSMSLISIEELALLIIALIVYYYHATYEFQSESTLYSLSKCQGSPFSKQALYLEIK